MFNPSGLKQHVFVNTDYRFILPGLHNLYEVSFQCFEGTSVSSLLYVNQTYLERFLYNSTAKAVQSAFWVLRNVAGHPSTTLLRLTDIECYMFHKTDQPPGQLFSHHLQGSQIDTAGSGLLPPLGSDTKTEYIQVPRWFNTILLNTFLRQLKRYAELPNAPKLITTTGRSRRSDWATETGCRQRLVAAIKGWFNSP